MKTIHPVCIVGAGLAGSECAYQLLKKNIPVLQIEMRPEKMSPAHSSALPAELVCSNSFRSLDILNAVGLLKEEMLSLDSLTMRAAYKARVPAGSALAVDREEFSKLVSERLQTFELYTLLSGEVVAIHNQEDHCEVILANGESIFAEEVVVATGPLTSDPLAKWILETTSKDSLYFYDAIAPIVDRDSIDMTKAFRASRYDKDQSEEGDYINCPMNKEQYENFISEITSAELIEVKDFDKAQFFEGCLPIEVMASRGPETLRYGPMKPVGIHNPHDPESKLHAVVQLRQDNRHGTLYNLVGFQTRMKYPEQKRIFQMIPGLEKAEFVRLGSMHRNTYLCSPVLLEEGMALKGNARLHFAGQITGCEGYVESAAVGLYVGGFLAHQILRKEKLATPPQTTALGALVHHLLFGDPENYQPMNINFGLFTDIELRAKKFDRKTKLVQRASVDFRKWYFDCWDF